MAKLYIAFHENGVVRDIGAEGGDGYLPLPGKNPSSLALRYALQDGTVVDRYPGQSDDEVLAVLKAEQEQRQPPIEIPKILDKLDFLRRFTREERIALRSAQAGNPVAADLLVLLDLSATVDLKDADLVANLTDLEAAGLLGEGRSAALLA